MIKRLLFYCFVLLFTTQLMAQTPITYQEYVGVAGESFDVHSSDYVDPGDPGLNQTWDLSALSSNDVDTHEYVPWGGSPYAGNFIDANYAIYSSAGVEDRYTYVSDQNDASFGLGFGSPDLIITFTNPQKIIEFPITLGDEFTDSFNATYTLDGSDWVNIGTVTSEVDGYGTLILPYGSVSEVYRIKQTIVQTNSSPEFGEFNFNITSYRFLKANIHFSLASTRVSVSDENTTQSASFLDETNVGISEFTINQPRLLVYPNPVSSMATIGVQGLTDPNATLELLDYTGRRVMGFDAIQRSFDGSLEIDFSPFQNGLYILKYASKYGVVSKRIVVEK